MEDLPKSGGTLGQYANCLHIGYNALEFVLDFSQSYTGKGAPQLATRIVTSPAFAKRFSEALAAAVREYELTLGPVPEE